MAKKVRRHELRHIVAVSNNKGGAGKTSTVLNLASAIARRIEGYRVLVIDCDPQRNLSYFLGWDDQRELEGSPTLYPALCNEQQGLPVYRADNGLYFTPASVNLNGIDAILSLRPNPSKALAEILQRPVDDHCGVKYADVTNDNLSGVYQEITTKESQLPSQLLHLEHHCLPTKRTISSRNQLRSMRRTLHQQK